MLIVNELTKIYKSKGKYDNDVTALRNVSLAFDDKGLVFVVGKSGSGKSTLLNLLGGLDTPDCGEIIINGKSTKDFTGSDYDAYRNTCVGFVFQEYNLIDGYTVEKNIALALNLQGKKADTSLIADCLSKVDMLAFAARKTNQLSGGQKQRVAIARALIKNPRIVLADEPTGALDSETGTQIMELLKRLSQDRLVVIVSHDLQYAEKYADRIIQLKDGMVVEDTNKPKPCETHGDNYPLIKSRLRFFDSFKMSVHSLRSKLSRLFLTMLLSVVSFSAFGFISALSNWNRVDAVTKSINANPNKEVALNNINDENYESLIFSSSKIDAIKDKFEDRVFVKEVVGSSQYGNRIGLLSVYARGHNNPNMPGVALNKVYENTDVYGYAHFDTEDIKNAGFSLQGRLPNSDTEIAISKNSYDSLKKLYGLSTFEGLVINLTLEALSNDQYEVVGVVDNHFDTRGYENVTEVDLARDKTISKRLSSDIKNGFNGIVYLNKTTFDLLKNNERSDLSFSNDGVYENIDVNSVCDNLDVLFNDYVIKKQELWCEEHTDYYYWHDGVITLQPKWFADNGYARDPDDDHRYIKTVHSESGDFEVSYDYSYESSAWVRTSEKEDDTLVWPETPAISVTKSDFLEKQFIDNGTINKQSLINADGSFVQINDATLIMGINSTNSNIYDRYIHKKQDIDIFTKHDDIKLNKINLLFSSIDADSGEPYTSVSMIVSPKNNQYILDRYTGCWRLNAILTENESLNREFVEYCFKVGNDGARIRIQNNSTSTIEEIDLFVKGDVLKILIAVAVSIALFSSLILMNFLFISMSYSKREIGILRGLGARNFDVLRIFADEGLLISLVNGALASLTTLILCSVLNVRFAAKLGVSVGILNFSILQPLLILGCCIVSSLIACSVPVIKNINKRPVDTINNK